MLGLINAVTATFGAIDRYVKQGLVMANRFLTPPKLSHPAQGSAEFDGASDYIQLDTPFSYTNHTIAAWVYNNQATPDSHIFDARDSGADGIRLKNQSGAILYTLNGSSIATSNTYVGEWFYIVATYNGTTAKIYIDGSEEQSVATSQTISTTTDACIGVRNFQQDTAYWNGNLANVAIWNRALSSDEINSVMWKPYQALTTTEKSGLKAWYSLDDISSPSASLATMEALAVDKDATIENKAAITAAINALS